MYDLRVGVDTQARKVGVRRVRAGNRTQFI